ncbi:uncharacterized protein BJX67DRAFT_373045 [Aspergillus lucknowensis]|uniref:SUN domain-containing protein n=1 Tax=Aspergillus lucknowensis TaxID=176173 RepID=A0ABR4LM89_9EURO
MLAPWWIATCWTSWAICVSAWTRGAGSEDQQPICLARGWREVEAGFLQWPACIETRWERKPSGDPTPYTQKPISEPTSISVPVETAQPSPAGEEADQELDTDSPLDNANFLSFEEWKKQNLAKAGQSAENVGGNRRAGSAGKDRRRPTGINNALDSLGDDGEIELDFGGFGADASEATRSAAAWGTHVLPDGEGVAQNLAADHDGTVDATGQGVPHTGGPRSKDAGTTCKERFNYASFDCAATVLKTNPQAKGSSSVLIENKDSYMLNECRAENKFLILELCDDILVDTVVLANYEFFSSIFHTFRVSVADRYPAKPDQWKELGVYEARNTREVQAFAVANPLIWARYLRIEFLTHYGHEYFCPLSLIRVHGTTMLEEYKHDGEVNRADEEPPGEVLEPTPWVDTAPELGDLAPSAPPALYNGDVKIASFVSKACPNPEAAVQLVLLGLWDHHTCSIEEVPPEPFAPGGPIPAGPGQASPSTVGPWAGDTAATEGGRGGGHAPSPEVGNSKAPSIAGVNTHSSPDVASTAAASDVTSHNATSETDTRPSGVSKDDQGANSTRATTTQPPAANPTTQESFFKSVNKRLQMLETNSSLSLQYIEEQSRILRDAFNKVEKRQLAKTSTFLENLNVTVVNELKQFRDQYDQAWRSVALEFEHQRIQYHQEIQSINTQLGVLADELVFQKRVAVVQSIMVLICFALVLFTRGTAGGYIDFPSVQNMVSRSYSFRSSSPTVESLSGSPGSARAVSSYRRVARHRRQRSNDSQGGSLSPAVVYAPLTPTSDDSGIRRDVRALTPSAPEESLSVSNSVPLLHRSNSSPADLRGENGADGLESESESMDSAPLAARSPNTHLAVSHEQEKNAATKMNSMDYHRQILQGKLNNKDKQQASYVSPSDDIMSPCSKKLSDLKGRRFKKIPPIALPFVSERAKKTLDLVEEFVEKECIPAEALFSAQLGEGAQRWTTTPAIMEELKAKARKLGLWNMFLPKNHFSQGAGFSNLEYGLMAEYLGKSKLASEATNNAAPDTGNMEVFAKYGNDAQKAQWLTPLLEGKIRSAFLMTEPDIASSDATNIQLEIRREGNEYVLNGSKWWSSGAGDPRCQIYLVMGKTDARNPDPYKQQSVVLVPANTPGVTIHRMLSVYGYDDAPHGHGHISFNNVRVPLSAMVLGEGRGFEIIQGRLGPGRIHHAMRTIGAAERAVDWLIARINDDRKKPFGQPLSSHGVILEWLAKSRIEIDAARLIVLNAAIKIDQGDAKFALKEIAQAKVLVPQTALTVIDRAVQAYGAAGVCQDTPLANLWALIRTLRIADGPDEVHLQQLGKRENKSRREEVTKRLAWQRETSQRILVASGFPKTKSHL